jgi:hypothetical protein
LAAGILAFQFPERVRRQAADPLENALAQMPVFVGIAQPPQSMSARLIGAG